MTELEKKQQLPSLYGFTNLPFSGFGGFKAGLYSAVRRKQDGYEREYLRRGECVDVVKHRTQAPTRGKRITGKRPGMFVCVCLPEKEEEEEEEESLCRLLLIRLLPSSCSPSRADLENHRRPTSECPQCGKRQCIPNPSM